MVENHVIHGEPSGRVLDLRSWESLVEDCVVSLSKTLYPQISTGSTKEYKNIPT